MNRAGMIRGRAARCRFGAGVTAGLVAGFTSFVSHAGGPPAAVYLLSRKLDKTAFQATTVIVVLADECREIHALCVFGDIHGANRCHGWLLAPSRFWGVVGRDGASVARGVFFV